MHERLIILDFGSQTTQLIGRRVRELNMYCEIVPYNKFPHDATDVKGVILSGSPYSVYDENAFKADLSQIRGKYPVLGICYGFRDNGGPFSLMQLKVIQEVITLVVFVVFSATAFKGESFHWNHAAACVCLILAVYFVFMK